MNSSDLKQTVIHEFLQPGDVVVGRYSDSGGQVKSSVTPDSADELARKRELMAHSAMSNGGEILTNSTVKSKPIKPKKRNVTKRASDPEPLTPLLTAQELENEPIRTAPANISVNTLQATSTVRTIQLQNRFGKLKMSVEDILENDMAFCLVFPNEDAVVFVPNPAETLNFIDSEGGSHTVYYANTLFTYGVKQLMILFKTEDKPLDE